MRARAGICALLENEGGTARTANLIPANSCHRSPGIHGVGHDQSLMISKITISQAIHQVVANTVHFLPWEWFRYADNRCGTEPHPRIDRNREGRTAKTRLQWIGKIHMKLIKAQRVRG